jgi:hypothetical protein
LSSRKKNTTLTSSVANSARAGAALEGLGQQVHEGGGQQRAGRQAEQVLRTGCRPLSAAPRTPRLHEEAAASQTLPMPETRVAAMMTIKFIAACARGAAAGTVPGAVVRS